MAKKPKAKEKTIVEVAKDRWERAVEAYSDNRKLARDDTRFALGDSDNNWQWPEAQRKAREADERVILTVNITAQHCNQIINNIRQKRPSLKVSPADSGGDVKTAEMLGGLIRNIQVASSADEAHDTAAEHSVYGGEGYWRVITEYESPKSFQQVILIKPITNPFLVYIDPDCVELDKSDAKWGFIFEDVPTDTIKTEHPDLSIDSWGEVSGEWKTEDTIRRAEYFYCDIVQDTLYLLEDGTTVLKSALPEGATAPAFVDERKTETRKWKWCKIVGGHPDPVDTRDWAGQFLPIVTVVGKEVNVDGEIVRKGQVRDLKDPARMVNFAYSETVQTLALQNKVPYLAAAEAIEGHETEWKNANKSSDATLTYNAYDEQGQPLPTPTRQQAAVLPTAQIQLLQLSTEQMRAASGQQNSNFGIKSEAQSGIGIERLKVQGEMATFHFPDNLSRALRYEAKLLVDLIQAIYDVPRVVRVLGLDGVEEQAKLDPTSEQAYAEMKSRDNDIQKIFNPTIGRYDVVIDTGPSYQTQRQETAANLNELAAKNPALLQIAGDLIMKAQDFPMADKMAERLAKTLPPELRDEEPGQDMVPPQAQAQMMQMQQQIEQMGQALEQATQQLQAAETEEQSKQAKIASDHAAKQQQMNLDAEAKIAQAEIDAKVALKTAKQANDTKVVLAQMEADTAIVIANMKIEAAAEEAEMNAYVEMQKEVKAGLRPAEELEAKPVPRLLRKRIFIQAPSGGVYTGTIEEESDEAGESGKAPESPIYESAEENSEGAEK